MIRFPGKKFSNKEQYSLCKDGHTISRSWTFWLIALSAILYDHLGKNKCLSLEEVCGKVKLNGVNVKTWRNKSWKTIQKRNEIRLLLRHDNYHFYHIKILAHWDGSLIMFFYVLLARKNTKTLSIFLFYTKRSLAKKLKTPKTSRKLISRMYFNIKGMKLRFMISHHSKIIHWERMVLWTEFYYKQMLRKYCKFIRQKSTCQYTLLLLWTYREFSVIYEWLVLPYH